MLKTEHRLNYEELILIARKIQSGPFLQGDAKEGVSHPFMTIMIDDDDDVDDDDDDDDEDDDDDND